MKSKKRKRGHDHFKPTDSEQEILQLLWKMESATVREIHTMLSNDRQVGYTTVLKLLQIMWEKEIVVRDESNRSHVYRAKQKAETTQRQLVKDFVNRVFGGSTDKLVLHALASKKTAPDEIAKIRQMLDELEKGEK